MEAGKIQNISLSEYDYELPESRIARYPLKERDSSKLLLYNGRKITEDVFRNIPEHIPQGSLLVFNNTSVIKARILFSKETGARIEVFCLEPLMPAEYESAFSSLPPVEWKCIIGNLKKWRSGRIYKKFISGGKEYELTAEKISQEGEAWRIRFRWNSTEIKFGDITDLVGHIPLPPYLRREDEEEDKVRYQTVYSSVKGSVAAPTAGLHFTGYNFEKLAEQGISTAELTLHVGAGTFQPVKSERLSDHKMHCEHFFINEETIEKLIRFTGRIIPVGTTSVRTLESLYWLGLRAINNEIMDDCIPCTGQWEPYEKEAAVSPEDALTALLQLLRKRKEKHLHASTSVMIIPGYKFRMTNGIITNFHQPRSTLLLLVSAWTGSDWKSIYRYALEHDFRFLSYGDSSILLQ